MKLDIKNILKYVVFFLLLFYTSQGIFLPTGLMISKVVLGVLLFIEVICFILSFSSFRKPVINALFILVLLNIIYYIFSEKHFYVAGNIGNSNALNHFYTWVTIKDICFNLLFFFIAFYLSKKNKITESNVKCFFYILFAMSIIEYFTNSNFIKTETGLDEYTNNVGYSFVHLMPFIFLIKRKDISMIFLFISLGFIMFAAKRGAIIIGILFSLLYIYNLYLKNAGHKFFRNIIIALILLLIVSFLVYNIYLSSDYLQLRMEDTLEGNSSGRNIFFAQMWNYWSNSFNSIWNFLFGFGFASSIKITGLYAHNDWLELLTMSGVFGVIIYLQFFLQLIKFLNKYELSFQDRNIFISIFIIWFLKTLFSMGYGDIEMIPIIILLGYLVGKYNSAKLIQKNSIKNINYK